MSTNGHSPGNDPRPTANEPTVLGSTATIAGPSTAEIAVDPHRRGTAGFNRLVLAMIAAGLTTFTTLYCVQALLPPIAHDFDLTPAQVSLIVSAATAGLAVAVLPISALANTYGRTRIMTISLFAAAVLGIASAAAPNFTMLLVLRTAQGIALAGAQVAAMTHLASEVHRGSLGLAMGLLIGGNGIGGMLGRLLASVLLDFFDWRVALAVVGALALCCAMVFRILIPPARFFVPAKFGPRPVARGIRRSLTDSAQLRLFAVGFLTMGVFVSVYNYLGFRLLAPPFSLPYAVIGFILVSYVAGAVASPLAGRIADRFGRQRVLWVIAVITLGGLALMLPSVLTTVIVGLIITTAGVFALHSVSSGWVGARSNALNAQGAAIYLLCYYVGSSIGGWVGGLAFGRDNWPALTGLIMADLLLIVGIALSLRQTRPIPSTDTPTA